MTTTHARRTTTLTTPTMPTRAEWLASVAAADAGPVRYLNLADVAELLGITHEAARHRHKGSTGHANTSPLPPADAYVGRYPGWLPATIAAHVAATRTTTPTEETITNLDGTITRTTRTTPTTTRDQP